MARKGIYEEWLKEDKLKLLEAWARDGLTNEQIANNIGIRSKTLYEWINRFSEIGNALKKGKEVVDIEVENSLLKRALGYNAKVLKHYKIKEKRFNKEVGAFEEVEKLVEVYDEVHMPPDTTAIIYWLKNRKPKQWRDKPTLENDMSTMIESMNTLTQAMLSNVAPNRKIDDFE